MAEDVHYTVHTNMVYLLIATAIILFISRIVINIIDQPSLLGDTRDIDFEILLLGLKNGLIETFLGVFNVFTSTCV